MGRHAAPGPQGVGAGVAVAGFAAILVLAACTAPVATSYPGTLPPTGPPAAEASPAPRVATFGPTYPARPEVGSVFLSVSGLLLSADRTVLQVGFVGAAPAVAGSPCGEAWYEPWTGVPGKTLDVAVVAHIVSNPGTPIPCVGGPVPYVYSLRLPAPFEGSTVRNIGKGTTGWVWLPSAERVVSPTALPAGWTTVRLETTDVQMPRSVMRTFALDPALGVVSPRWIVLTQWFDVTLMDDWSPVVAGRAVIHGVEMPVYEAPGGGFAAQWGSGPDTVRVEYRDADITLEAFVEFANSVTVPVAAEVGGSPAP